MKSLDSVSDHDHRHSLSPHRITVHPGEVRVLQSALSCAAAVDVRMQSDVSAADNRRRVALFMLNNNGARCAAHNRGQGRSCCGLTSGLAEGRLVSYCSTMRYNVQAVPFLFACQAPTLINEVA